SLELVDRAHAGVHDLPHHLGRHHGLAIDGAHVVNDLVDDDLHRIHRKRPAMAPAASETACARGPAPAIWYRPSWATSMDSMAAAPWAAESCGPAYLTGSPRLNPNTVCGCCAAFCTTTSPSRRRPTPRMKLPNHIQRSGLVVRPRLSTSVAG